MSRTLRLARAVWIRVERLVVKLGAVPSNRDYCRFVVLTSARCGSNLLIGLLASHPSVRVFGEIFRDYNAIGWDTPGYPRRDRMMLNRFQTDPMSFVETDLFSRRPARIRAVGYKMFYCMMDDYRL